MRTARRLLGLAVLLVASSVTVSDTGAAVRLDGRASADGGTLEIGTTDFDYIDPALTQAPGSISTFTAWAVADATCAKLLRYPSSPVLKQDYTLVPEVAASLPEVSHHGRTYTFTIRKGYRFSNGAPVTAKNYVRAINRVLNPEMGSPAAMYLQEIVGAKAMQQGAQSASGVTAKGARLIVQLTKRVPDFPARMTMPYLCPVPTDLAIDPEGVSAPLPGSGPYYVAEFVRGSRVEVRRNPFYRGPRAGHVSRMVVHVDPGQETISRQVEAGEWDVDLQVPIARLLELGAKYTVNKKQLFSVPSANLFYLYMNTEQPLFRDNPKLRQAVNFAIDRTEMLRALGAPWAGRVTDDYLPSSLPGYVDGHVYPNAHPNLKDALALARGHTKSGKAVMYTCNNVTTGCLDNAQTIQKNLRAIGIDVTINQFPLTELVRRTSTRGEPFDLVFNRYVVPWVDPYQYVDLLLDGRKIGASDNTNLSYFNSPHYNRLIDQANALSGSARYRAYGRLAVDIARNAAPMAAVFGRNTRFFVSKRVGCMRVSADGLDLAGLCLN